MGLCLAVKFLREVAGYRVLRAEQEVGEHTGARKAGSVKAWGRRYNFAIEFKVFKGLVRWPDKSQSSWPRGLRGWLRPGSLSSPEQRAGPVSQTLL